MAGTDNSLTAFLEENPAPTPDDLYAAFGPPQEMAEILMEDVTPQEQAQHRRITLLARALAGIIAIVLVLTSVYVLFVKEFRITVIHDIKETTNNWDDECISTEENSTP